MTTRDGLIVVGLLCVLGITPALSHHVKWQNHDVDPVLLIAKKVEQVLIGVLEEYADFLRGENCYGDDVTEADEKACCERRDGEWDACLKLCVKGYDPYPSPDCAAEGPAIVLETPAGGLDGE